MTINSDIFGGFSIWFSWGGVSAFVYFYLVFFFFDYVLLNRINLFVRLPLGFCFICFFECDLLVLFCKHFKKNEKNQKKFYWEKKNHQIKKNNPWFTWNDFSVWLKESQSAFVLYIFLVFFFLVHQNFLFFLPRWISHVHIKHSLFQP